MTNKKNLFEFEDRFCPICGEPIKIGESLHRCDEKKLKEIEKKLKKAEKQKKERRTYGEKLEEYDKFYNPDNYEQEEEEDV